LKICAKSLLNTLFLKEPINSELRLAVLNFLFSALIVLNLFLIYNQKYCYTSLLKSCMKFLFVFAQLESSSCTLISVKKNALC